VLLGRRTECVTLDQLIAAVRTGESRVLVVNGEAGSGKSALLAYVHEQASGCRVARAVGVQSEMELAFSALHLLCVPMLDRLDRLPEPQRDALGTAFGLRSGPAPDRFLIGLAVLSLLSEVADERPLICLGDDAQWLDRASAQALAFVARRLFAESVALVFAVREASEQQDLTRSAAYRSATRQQRRSVHRSPADATDPDADPDRRVWHRARATVGHDEDVAAELERSAGRAQARGGMAAAAAFLERAAALSPDAARRAARALAAAQAKFEAGARADRRPPWSRPRIRWSGLVRVLRIMAYASPARDSAGRRPGGRARAGLRRSGDGPERGGRLRRGRAAGRRRTGARLRIAAGDGAR
jgi:AAA ATPase domain